jgi:hypothetical protein
VENYSLGVVAEVPQTAAKKDSVYTCLVVVFYYYAECWSAECRGALVSLLAASACALWGIV